MYACTQHEIDVTIRPAPTGFNYLGHVVSGELSSIVDGTTYQARNTFHFSGQIQSQDISIRYLGLIEHVLAEFAPTGLYRMYGISGEAIHGQSVDVRVVDPALHDDLMRTVGGTRDCETCFDKFSKCLLQQASRARSRIAIVDDAADAIESARGVARIADIARDLGVSERTLSRQFSEIVGLPPKFYARVVQMNTVLAMLMFDDKQSLTRLAQDCGYFDQSHFNKAMMLFSNKVRANFSKASTTS